MDIFM